MSGETVTYTYAQSAGECDKFGESRLGAELSLQRLRELEKRERGQELAPTLSAEYKTG